MHSGEIFTFSIIFISGGIFGVLLVLPRKNLVKAIRLQEQQTRLLEEQIVVFRQINELLRKLATGGKL